MGATLDNIKSQIRQATANIVQPPQFQAPIPYNQPNLYNSDDGGMTIRGGMLHQPGQQPKRLAEQVNG